MRVVAVEQAAYLHDGKVVVPAVLPGGVTCTADCASQLGLRGVDPGDETSTKPREPRQAELVTEAWRMQAPKHLRRELDDVGSESLPAEVSR